MTTRDKLPPLEDLLTIRVTTHINSHQQALELEDERERSEAIAKYGAKICEASRIRDLAKPYDALIRELQAERDKAIAAISDRCDYAQDSANERGLEPYEHAKRLGYLAGVCAAYDLIREAFDPEFRR